VGGGVFGHDLPPNDATDRLIPENALKMRGYANVRMALPGMALF
jgi:hypothetical protein